MRLFIGLGLTGEARNALGDAVSAMGIAGQYTARENYHVTLAFLGERDERQLPRIRRIVEAAAGEHEGMTLTIDGLGNFGRQENALLYAKLAPCAQLSLLAGTLRRLLTEAGESFDPKPFTPHITLARKTNLTLADISAPLTPVAFAADTVTLYHSTRVEGELRYLPIFQSPLRKDVMPA